MGPASIPSSPPSGFLAQTTPQWRHGFYQLQTLKSVCKQPPSRRRHKYIYIQVCVCVCMWRVRDHHCLGNPSQPLEEWAPTTIIHAVSRGHSCVVGMTSHPTKKKKHEWQRTKALETCGVRFDGPMVMHQRDTATVLQTGGVPMGRRFVVSHRRQTVLRSQDCAPTVDN